MAVARRVAAGVGLEEVIHLERRVDALAEGVAENAVLAGPLEVLVAGLERSLVTPLEQRERMLARRARHR
jgi:hypothetical protein